MLVCCKPIKGYNVFSATFKVGMKLKTDCIFSSIVFNKNITTEEENHTIYYGVTISKKNAKKSVIRNRVKRLLRESIKTLLKEFEPTELTLIDAIIFAWQIAPAHPNEITLDFVKSAVKNILEQALVLYKKKNYGIQKKLSKP